MITASDFIKWMNIFHLTPGGGGGGDVVGPGSSVDSTIALFSGTTGKLLSDSPVSVAVSGDIVTPGRITTHLNSSTVTLPGGTILAAMIYGGVIELNAPTAGLTVPFDSATNILAAIGTPTAFSGVSFQLVNLGVFPITLQAGAGMVLNGMPTVIIGPFQTFDLNLVFTAVSPTPLCTVSGGTNLTNLNYPPQYSEGFQLFVSSLTQVIMTKGATRDSTQSYNILLPTNVTLDIAVSGVNGLDTGTVAPSTQYFIYVIADSTGVNPTRGIFSLSGSAPLLPSGYNIFALRGYIITDVSSNLEQVNLVDLVNFLPLDNPTFTGVLSGPEGIFTTLVTEAFSAKNTNLNLVYVSSSPATQTPDGSFFNPYPTISAAQASITTATPTNVFTIIVNSDITDTGQIYLSPNINVFATSPDFALNNSLDIIEDPAWATAVPGSSYSYWQNMAIYGNVAIDFSTFGSSIFPFFQFIQTFFNGSTVVINGNPNSSGFPSTSVYFYQCYISAGLQIDNCYVYGADNQWISAAYFGSGAATSCVEYYSVGDIFYSGLNFYDSNTASCSPVIQSNGTVYSTTGVLIDSGVGAVSTINVDIVGTLSNTPFSFYVDDSAGGAINATIVGSGQISSVTVTDQSTGGSQVVLTLDGAPATLNIALGTPSITYNYISSAADIDTDQGFAVEPNGPQQFSWTGDGSLGGNAYTLLAGRGAHTTGGTDNIMLGKSATTNWIGGFMFCDSTNSSGGAYFPQGNNQVIFNAAGGFGIGNNSNTGTLGPQAGFHYANYNGNDGNFLFSGAGAVVSANMNILEINPYVSANTLAIQYTGSTGTAFTVTFPSGGGTVPTLAGNQTWTGFNVYSQPIISSSVGLFATVFTLYSGSVTLAPADMIGGTIIANSVGAASFQMPTFTSFDAAMATFFNQTIPVNSLIFFTIENINAGAITLTPNTGFIILTENGAPVAAPFKSASYRAVKASSSSYTLYGS